jgi:hypothetical protein
MTPKPLRAPRVKEPTVTDPETVSRVETYINVSVPELHKIATRRALLGMMSRTNAIKIKCLSCCNYQREEIKTCGVVTCPLHPVRPYVSADEDPSAVDADL